jgi:hypothetical protein
MVIKFDTGCDSLLVNNGGSSSSWLFYMETEWTLGAYHQLLGCSFQIKAIRWKSWKCNLGENWHGIEFWAVELTISIKIPFHVTSSETQCYKLTLCERSLKKFGYYLNSHVVYRFNADLTKQIKFWRICSRQNSDVSSDSFAWKCHCN